MSQAAPEALGLNLSGVTLRLAGQGSTLDRRLRQDWAAFVAEPEDSPTLEIAVEFVDRAYSEVVYRPKSMRSTLSAATAHFGMPEGEAVVIAPGTARLSLVNGLGDLSYYTMLNLMRACLAWVMPNRGGALVHAAALVLDERAFLLVGAEGAGKSTWVRLGEEAGGRAVSDDLVLVDGTGSRHEVLGTPLRSTHVARYGLGRWPLAAILFPRHGAAPSLEPVADLLAEARITANLPFIADGLEDDPRIGGIAGTLAREVPCAELTFARDPGFVELLRAFGSE